MSELYHFCCSHSATEIDKTGVLRPIIAWRKFDEVLTLHGHARTGLHRAPAVLWLTDLAEPDRDGLGLTSVYIACDRTEFRYSVDARDAMPWFKFVDRWHPARDWLDVLQQDRRAKWKADHFPRKKFPCVICGGDCSGGAKKYCPACRRLGNRWAGSKQKRARRQSEATA